MCLTRGVQHRRLANNTHTVSSSWWWAYKCPKHVEHIVSVINHSVASSWFFFSTHMQRCTDIHRSSLHVGSFLTSWGTVSFSRRGLVCVVSKHSPWAIRTVLNRGFQLPNSQSFTFNYYYYHYYYYYYY